MANQNLTYQEKQEIKQLSQLFLGSSSRWQKIVEKGSVVMPKDAEGKNLATDSGQLISMLERPTARELLDKLREAKKALDENMERRRQAQAAIQAAQNAAGSVG